MAFKSAKQRKAVMAKLSQQSYSQLKRSGINLKPKGDIDKDGVQNSKDCKPFDPEKQGLLHEINIKLLKRKEEKLEAKREKQMQKLEDIKDTLKYKQKIASKTDSIKRTQLKEKQAVIDEINKEKKRSEILRKQERKAKEALDKLTITGKTKTAAKKAAKAIEKESLIAAKATNAFLNKESTKRAVRQTTKALAKAVFGQPITKRRRTLRKR